MINKIIDIVVIICAAWIIVARFFLPNIRYALVAAAVIIVLQVIKLISKKA